MRAETIISIIVCVMESLAVILTLIALGYQILANRTPAVIELYPDSSHKLAEDLAGALNGTNRQNLSLTTDATKQLAEDFANLLNKTVPKTQFTPADVESLSEIFSNDKSINFSEETFSEFKDEFSKCLLK